MDGDVVGPEGQALVQGPAEALRRVGRKPGDQVHVHMGKAHGRGQGHGVLNVPGGVAAADGPEHFILQGLGIDADAVGPVVQQHLELFPGDGVGPSGLDAVFRAAGQVEAAVQVGQQPVHLPGGQGGGGAAAHIEGLDAQARLPDHLGGVGDLPAQHL